MDVDFGGLLVLLRSRTEANLARLRADVDSVSEARRDSNVDDEHDPEGATIAFELSQASTLVQDAIQRRNEIDAALERLDGGTFGVCLSCGQPIAESRLEARPWAAYCIDCASR